MPYYIACFHKNWVLFGPGFSFILVQLHFSLHLYNIIFHIIVVYENCNCSSVNLFGHFSSIYFDTYCLTYFIGIQVGTTYILQYQYLILDMKIELEKHFKLHKVHKKTEVTANR